MDDEPRCTLADSGGCYCTGRAGCLQANEDAFDDPDADWHDEGPDVDTVQPSEAYL